MMEFCSSPQTELYLQLFLTSLFTCQSIPLNIQKNIIPSNALANQVCFCKSTFTYASVYAYFYRYYSYDIKRDQNILVTPGLIVFNFFVRLFCFVFPKLLIKLECNFKFSFNFNILKLKYNFNRFYIWWVFEESDILVFSELTEYESCIFFFYLNEIKRLSL